MRRALSPAFCLASVVILLGGPAFASELTPLVDVAWVKANADRDDVVLLDIRNKIDGGSPATFAKGHIPGAVHSDYLKGGWRTEIDGVIAQAPRADQLEALSRFRLGRFGRVVHVFFAIVICDSLRVPVLSIHPLNWEGP